ncbi:hypothetical protein DFH08DRAFT_808576 [Mycena albidolilacea]|uniref:Uncharacterized protein n=1 Tax=Mycena albidolilacea TaxID=1033008 RepID=A0AAD7A1U0_9AGAR|nr:hypothetical protein DFH08DRAFT_808576 [Mycena albidolilacea]
MRVSSKRDSSLDTARSVLPFESTSSNLEHACIDSDESDTYCRNRISAWTKVKKISRALCFRLSENFLQKSDPILESIQPQGGAAMAQGVNDEGYRHDTESEVGEDAAGDKGQCLRKSTGRGSEEGYRGTGLRGTGTVAGAGRSGVYGPYGPRLPDLPEFCQNLSINKGKPFAPGLADVLDPKVENQSKIGQVRHPAVAGAEGRRVESFDMPSSTLSLQEAPNEVLLVGMVSASNIHAFRLVSMALFSSPTISHCPRRILWSYPSHPLATEASKSTQDAPKPPFYPQTQLPVSLGPAHDYRQRRRLIQVLKMFPQKFIPLSSPHLPGLSQALKLPSRQASRLQVVKVSCVFKLGLIEFQAHRKWVAEWGSTSLCPVMTRLESEVPTFSLCCQ